MDDKLYIAHGSSGDDAFDLVVTPEQAGWTYSGLKVLTLPPGGTHTWATGDDELLVLPLAGSAAVTVEGQTFDLHGPPQRVLPRQRLLLRAARRHDHA